MAEIFRYTEEQEKIFNDFVDGLPSHLKELAKRFPSNKIFRHKKTNQIVMPNSFNEDGTMTVNIYRFLNNPIHLTKTVFGVDPEDLEEADLPNGIKEVSFDKFQSLMYI